MQPSDHAPAVVAPALKHPVAIAPASDLLSDVDALALADVDADEIGRLAARASALRDRVFGATLTYSPKVFLPITNLCRNRCDYCSFRRSPGDAGEWTMTPEEVQRWIAGGREQGCVEALLCLGDKPEGAFSAYRRTLAGFGQRSTVGYLDWASRVALEHGLLPHTNAGVLTESELRQLRATNVSLGLMLENVSERLCQPGMPHHKAPDKRPRRRLQMIAEAGQLAIPFTTGILIGIGETRLERVQSLLAIRALQHEYGHIQEVIVQNFSPRAHIALQADAPDDLEMRHAVALARLILPSEVSLQAPPNLNPARTAQLIAAGINDFGGISPLTPDYINPQYPWPHLDRLAASCAREGFTLHPRLPIYDRFVDRPGYLDDALQAPVARARQRLQLAAAARAEAVAAP